MKLATILGGIRTVLAAAVFLCATAAWADDASEIIKRLGKPDKDDSTEYDQPRPPVVTRWLDYTRQNVRVMLVPANRVGDPPPYTWKLMGFTDLARRSRPPIWRPVGDKAKSYPEVSSLTAAKPRLTFGP